MLYRLRNIQRTLWQLRIWATCGTKPIRLANEMVLTGQCIQRKWELAAMMARVKRLQPAIVVEIGTYRGGSLHCWSSVCPPTTHFVSIDLPWEANGEVDPEADMARMRDLFRPGQLLDWLKMDSHAAGTKNKLKDILDSRQVDFLFIDGDHSYLGVKRDYELYHELVRPGGLIAFHDIVPNKNHPEHDVHVFWGELKRRHRIDEVVDNNDREEPWGGIGVIYV
jgi:predicted O-methyltransferase YrrM